jgi:hypothetical protein
MLEVTCRRMPRKVGCVCAVFPARDQGTVTQTNHVWLFASMKVNRKKQRTLRDLYSFNYALPLPLPTPPHIAHLQTTQSISTNKGKSRAEPSPRSKAEDAPSNRRATRSGGGQRRTPVNYKLSAYIELGVLDPNNEIAYTEPSSSERKGKRPSTLHKTRKSDAEYDPPLSPSVKAESSKHKEKSE